MTVDVAFYVLNRDPRELTACRLAEKSYEANLQAFILTPSEAEAAHLDQLLWTFRQGSFIPHTLYPMKKGKRADPVLIGWQSPDSSLVPCQLLINLTDGIPSGWSSFQRIIEFVTQDESQAQQARVHYRYYRDQQCELKTYTL